MVAISYASWLLMEKYLLISLIYEYIILFFLFVHKRNIY